MKSNQTVISCRYIIDSNITALLSAVKHGQSQNGEELHGRDAEQNRAPRE